MRTLDEYIDTSSEGIGVPLNGEVVEEMIGWISTNADLRKKRKKCHPEEAHLKNSTQKLNLGKQKRKVMHK